jgi:hypothetical protein
MSSGNIDFNNLIDSYQKYSSNVEAMTTSISNTTSGGVQMSKLFKLQMAMNVLSMFGQITTNVMQGVQDVAMSISRNTKGS